MSKEYVYYFGGGKASGKAEMKNLLGGKGANLAEMTNIGIPVPAGFTISTDVCNYFYGHDGKYPEELEKQVEDGLHRIEDEMGAGFGDPENPLLLSVRSGARISMPGMMDTVLNLGLNAETVEGLARKAGDRRFAYDCYRRFIQMYGDVVLGLKPRGKDDLDPFEKILSDKKKKKGVEKDIELETEDLRELAEEYKEMIREEMNLEFPEDPSDQLWKAIGAVFNSWNNKRARVYRKLNDIPAEWGTAVNVQSMVFGNMGEKSGTGVAFTRDPATGDNILYGEYLMNAQGEDVVAGIRTPQPLNNKQKGSGELPSLEEEMPGIYKQLEGITKKLENHYRDMQDLEFTIQDGRLWLLQTRTGKRTGFAAIRIAVDMVREKIIGREEALTRIEPEQLNQFLRPIFSSQQKEEAVEEGRLLARGLNAGPGAATGRVVFNAEDAEREASSGEDVILVRIETSPEDIHGMSLSAGILTSAGGATSHAALVARQMGKVCVAGAKDLNINYKDRTIKVGGQTVKEGDYISIDGTTGEVIRGRIPTHPSEVIQVLLEGTMDEDESQIYQDYKELMGWANDIRELKVRANADRPEQASRALSFGAEGIGLCRTEHMFFEGERINAVRRMILASGKEGREEALNELLPMQKEDFKGIFQAMGDRPVTVRTLDPPLHEFLPSQEEEINELASKLDMDNSALKEKIISLREANPMLGHRGCRLGIVYPEITGMQVRAVFEAACEVSKEGGNPVPEIMIPLVGNVRELEQQREVVEKTAREVQSEMGVDLEYMVGTMIEIPRAVVTAGEIAEKADFFSFGTNDLTQTTLGVSRDDAGKFMNEYINSNIWPSDPFQKLDFEGVGELIKMGVTGGRRVKNDLKIGICGEHGGDPASIRFCAGNDFNYVSCSPFRVPIAILAAAQASLDRD